MLTLFSESLRLKKIIEFNSIPLHVNFRFTRTLSFLAYLLTFLRNYKHFLTVYNGNNIKKLITTFDNLQKHVVNTLRSIIEKHKLFNKLLIVRFIINLSKHLYSVFL